MDPSFTCESRSKRWTLIQEWNKTYSVKIYLFLYFLLLLSFVIHQISNHPLLAALLLKVFDPNSNPRLLSQQEWRGEDKIGAVLVPFSNTDNPHFIYCKMGIKVELVMYFRQSFERMWCQCEISWKYPHRGYILAPKSANAHNCLGTALGGEETLKVWFEIDS